MKKILFSLMLLQNFVTNAQNKFFIFEIKDDETNTPKREMVQYTDFLGFGNDRPNGLLQQKFLFKWPLNKTTLGVGSKISFQPFRSILIPSILFNRIDKAKDDSSLLFPVGYTIKQIDTGSSAQKDTSLSPVLGTFDIMRYTSLKIETRIVLLAINIGNTRIYFDWQGGLLRNKIADTLTKQDRVSSKPTERAERFVYSYVSGLSIFVKSMIEKELNIEIEVGRNTYKLLDNFFKQYDVFKTDNEGKKSIAFPVGEKYNRTSHPIYYGSVTLRKDWGEGEKKNSGFFRITYHYQNGQFNYFQKERPGKVISDKFYNHFLQLQLGVSFDLDKIFSNG